MKPFPLSEEEEHIWTAVDEAGSNAVLGPIVLAAITASKPQLEVLWNRGLSLPHLGPTQRDRLAIEIRKTVSYARVLMVEAEEINDLMEENRLSVEEILSLKVHFSPQAHYSINLYFVFFFSITYNFSFLKRSPNFILLCQLNSYYACADRPNLQGVAQADGYSPTGRLQPEAAGVDDTIPKAPCQRSWPEQCGLQFIVAGR
jgi:hypothetical protein